MRRSQLIQGALSVALIFIFWRVFSFGANRGTFTASHDLWTRKQRANAIRTAFVHGWQGYNSYAFPHDTLKPLTNASLNDRYSISVSTTGPLQHTKTFVEVGGVARPSIP
jgi:hypothetical protein